MNTTNTNEPIEQKEKQKGTLFVADLEMRDFFAAKAMQGLIAHEERAKPLASCNLGDFDVRVAVCAYRYADAMLKAREA